MMDGVLTNKNTVDDTADDTAGTSPGFGTLLGTRHIAGTQIDIFSNGANRRPDDIPHSHDDLGRYLGLKYQCVEFVRRFIWLHHGINLAQYWRAGNADAWVENARRMRLRPVSPGTARPGDIAVFTGGPHGHVAIVQDIDHDGRGFTLTGQNLFNDPRDIAVALTRAMVAGEATLAGGHGNCYSFHSFLRVDDA